MAKKLCSTKDLPREEWLEWRRGGIGGSDAGVIVGLNPWRSRIELYADKCGLLPEKEDSEQMRIGRDLEAYVAERWAEATGKKFRKTNFMYAHDDYDFIRANVDREVVGEKAGLECKTTSAYSKTDFANGEIPLQYYCQCQHYCAVMGYERMYLAILVLGKAFYHFVIERNDDEIAALIDNEVEFWKHHVEPHIPPDPDGSESAAVAIQAIHGTDKPTGGSKVLLQYENSFARLNALQKEIDALTKESDAIRQEIMVALGDATEGSSEQYLVTYRPQTRTSVDSKVLKTKWPDVYNECLRTTESRPLRIKEMKKREEFDL